MNLKQGKALFFPHLERLYRTVESLDQRRKLMLIFQVRLCYLAIIMPLFIEILSTIYAGWFLWLHFIRFSFEFCCQRGFIHICWWSTHRVEEVRDVKQVKNLDESLLLFKCFWLTVWVYSRYDKASSFYPFLIVFLCLLTLICTSHCLPFGLSISTHNVAVILCYLSSRAKHLPTTD